MKKIDYKLKTEKCRYIFTTSFYNFQIRETTETLERRMHQMEIDLEGEIKEREGLNKQLRRTEKDLADTTSLLIETQEAEESYRGQVRILSPHNHKTY